MQRLLSRRGRRTRWRGYLGAKKLSFHDLSVKLDANDREGINGKASIHALRVDTLQLDTIYFTIRQDSSVMALKGWGHQWAGESAARIQGGIDGRDTYQ